MKRRTLLKSLSLSLFTLPVLMFPQNAKAQAIAQAIGGAYDKIVVDMVEVASRLIKDQGLDDAIANSTKETWDKLDKGLYIFVMNDRGVLQMHPQVQMIGTNILRTRDANGEPFIDRIIRALAATEETVWTEYLWNDPIDGHVRTKRVFSKKIGKLIVSCGYYTSQA